MAATFASASSQQPCHRFKNFGSTHKHISHQITRCCPKQKSTTPKRIIKVYSKQTEAVNALSLFPLQVPELIPGLRANETALVAIQAAAFLAGAAYFDAAYSGDWSRIGVLTKAQELQLQQFALPIVAIHSVLAVLAALSASAMGRNPAVAAAKGLFCGTTGLFEYTVSPKKSPKS